MIEFLRNRKSHTPIHHSFHNNVYYIHNLVMYKKYYEYDVTVYWVLWVFILISEQACHMSFMYTLLTWSGARITVPNTADIDQNNYHYYQDCCSNSSNHSSYDSSNIAIIITSTTTSICRDDMHAICNSQLMPMTVQVELMVKLQ